MQNPPSPPSNLTLSYHYEFFFLRGLINPFHLEAGILKGSYSLRISTGVGINQLIIQFLCLNSSRVCARLNQNRILLAKSKTIT